MLELKCLLLKEHSERNNTVRKPALISLLGNS